MQAFLKRFSILPNRFIDDFYNIAPEKYDDDDAIIDVETVAKWLLMRKDNVKRILVENFDEGFDFTISKVDVDKNVRGGAWYYERILLTPDCFKQICMISNTRRAKQVRRYFLTLEKLIKRYHFYIEERLYKKIGILEFNQKPKININGGVVYFFEALNYIKIDEQEESLYKIGKSMNIDNRLNVYNSGNANNTVPLFVIEVDDIDAVENCIKNVLKNYQYRKHKEIYQISVDDFKLVFEECRVLLSGFYKYMMSTDEEKKRIASKRMRNAKYGLLTYFQRNDLFVDFLAESTDIPTDD